MNPNDPSIIDVYPEGADGSEIVVANTVDSDLPKDEKHRHLGFFAFGVYGPDGAKIQYGTLGNGDSAPFQPIFPPPFPPPPGGNQPWNQDFVVRAEAMDRSEARRAKARFWRMPLIMFALTCYTTWYAGKIGFDNNGYLFALAVMTILSCHEMGHFLQTLRYRVRSSLPYFIPMPFGPIGTMGAIIQMDGRIPNIKALFDIGISGPLAGLIPTFIFCWLGIHWSHIGPVVFNPNELEFGQPLLFDWLTYWIFGPLPEDTRLNWHPFAFAGWVGLFITSLNLLPIGQLDGGHIFYAIFKKKSAVYSALLFYMLIFLVCYFGLWTWSLMLLLLALMGTQHPPTQNDSQKLGPFRKFLGIATLAFILIGFTPNPIQPDFETEPDKPIKMYALR